MSRANYICIILAREVRGLTQSEIAKMIGVQQPTISLIESGQLDASDEIIERLSAGLDFPKDYFFDSLDFRHLPVSFARKRNSVTQKVARKLRARMNLVRRRIEILSRAVDFPEVDVPSINLDARKIEPEWPAAEVRAAWNVPPGPIDNVARLLEGHGILIAPMDFETDKVDGFSIYERNSTLPPIIFIRPSMPGDRSRYTLAHELAHIVLHATLPMSPDRQDIEEDADRFAAEFLMPKHDVVGHIVRGMPYSSFVALKPYWKVSVASLIMRAKTLGKITDFQYRRLFTQLGGRRLSEPYPLPPEDPLLIRQTIELHTRSLGHSEETLSRMLKCSRKDLVNDFPVRAVGGLRIVQ